MYGNPYYNQIQRYQPVEPINQQVNTQPYIQPIPQTTNQVGLLGKSVDSIDVVKGMDIPLDGRISYFPLTDGSAIVTKKLQNDGTSKMIVYKPVEENEKEKIKFATIEDIDKRLEKIDFSEIDDLKDDLEDLKKELKDIKNKLKNKKED